MRYKGSAENPQEIHITAYSDADYAGNKECRRSRTGYAIIIMGGLIGWQSKLQPTIATSTTEAEYQAASAAIKETLWMRNLLKQLLEPKKITVTVMIDNQSTLRLLRNPQSVTQAKHIDVQHHFIRERAMRAEVNLVYCRTEEMWADYLTKQVPSEKFKNCIKNLGMITPQRELSGSVEKHGFNEVQFTPRGNWDAPKPAVPACRDGESNEHDTTRTSEDADNQGNT